MSNTMPDPQAGIFVEGSTAHQFLEYALDDLSDPTALMAALAQLVDDAAITRESVASVIAFGPDLWSRASQLVGIDWEPTPFADYAAVDGGIGRRSPSSQADLFIWVHGKDRSAVLDAALAVSRQLAEIADLKLDESGFEYHDSRDLTGFIDGTANPAGDAARTAALIADGAPGAGGSMVVAQKWLHDLESFNAIDVKEQEQVIGRTKADSIELTGDDMLPDSHVSRTDATRDGVAQKIYRRSAPFGGAGEHGLYFLAFACDQTRFDYLLARMFGTADDDLHDRLTEFTRPVTGSYWFAPDAASLAKVIGSV